jgi:hypothetical protein
VLGLLQHLVIECSLNCSHAACHCFGQLAVVCRQVTCYNQHTGVTVQLDADLLLMTTFLDAFSLIASPVGDLLGFVFAAFGKNPHGKGPGRVFYDMFQCWRDAFEDFIPGVKAEWKGVFSNRVSRLVPAAACSHPVEKVWVGGWVEKGRSMRATSTHVVLTLK